MENSIVHLRENQVTRSDQMKLVPTIK